MKCEKIFIDTKMLTKSFERFCKVHYEESCKLAKNSKYRPNFQTNRHTIELCCSLCKIGINNWSDSSKKILYPEQDNLELIKSKKNFKLKNDYNIKRLKPLNFIIQVQEVFRGVWIHKKKTCDFENFIELKEFYNSIDLDIDNLSGKRIIVKESKQVKYIERNI